MTVGDMLDFLQKKINPLKKILFIPDLHFPYNDKKYWRLLMKVAKDLKPNIIVIVGDFIDCYCVSDYNKDPKRINTLKEETASARQGLRELESLNAEENIYCFGNHESRLDRIIVQKAPALKGLVDIETLLDLRKWRVVEYQEHTTIGKLNITHDVGHAGKYAAFQTLDAFQDNVVIGHTHRASVVYQGTVAGIPHVCMNLGWGGSVDDIDYMHKAKANRDWMHSFGLGYMEKNGIVHCQIVPVINKKCVIEGKLYGL